MTDATTADVRCSISGTVIPAIPDNDFTIYRGLTRRYRGFFSPSEGVALCVSVDRGRRLAPKGADDLMMLREDLLEQIRPVTPEAPEKPAFPAEVEEFLQALWHCADNTAVGDLIGATASDVIALTAEHIDVSEWPSNPHVPQGFEIDGRDDRLARTLDAGLFLLDTRPEDEATWGFWEAIFDACRRRIYGVRDALAPLDDTRDPRYMVGPIRQLLVQAGNQLLKLRKPREARLCFQTVIAANPELSEVQYAHCVAANNVVAHASKNRVDRVRALRAFNAFLRSSSAKQDPKRLATVNFLRRQIMGMRKHPKP